MNFVYLRFYSTNIVPIIFYSPAIRGVILHFFNLHYWDVICDIKIDNFSALQGPEVRTYDEARDC